MSTTTVSIQLNNLLNSPMFEKDANGNLQMTWAWKQFFIGLAGPTSLTVDLAADGSLSINDYGLVTEVIPPTAVPEAIHFVSNEWLTGLFDGVNTVFTAAHIPIPSTSLALYQNGMRLSPGTDFSIFGDVVTMVVAPAPGSTLTADYRY